MTSTATAVTPNQMQRLATRQSLCHQARFRNPYNKQAMATREFVDWLVGWGVSTSQLLATRIQKPHRHAVELIFQYQKQIASRALPAAGALGEDSRSPWHGKETEYPLSVLLPRAELSWYSNWDDTDRPARAQRPEYLQRALLAQPLVIAWLRKSPGANVIPMHICDGSNGPGRAFGRASDSPVTARRKQPDVVLVLPDDRIIAVYVQRPDCADYDDMPTVPILNQMLSEEPLDGIIHVYPRGSEWQMSTPQYLKRMAAILSTPAGKSGRIQMALGEIPTTISAAMAVPDWYEECRFT